MTMLTLQEGREMVGRLHYGRIVLLWKLSSGRRFVVAKVSPDMSANKLTNGMHATVTLIRDVILRLHKWL